MTIKPLSLPGGHAQARLYERYHDTTRVHALEAQIRTGRAVHISRAPHGGDIYRVRLTEGVAYAVYAGGKIVTFLTQEQVDNVLQKREADKQSRPRGRGKRQL